jgi:hypothetical protein
MKVHELLDDPSKWIQGKYAVDKEGTEVTPDSEHACAWCLVGAIKKCYPDITDGRRVTAAADEEYIIKHLRQIISNKYPSLPSSQFVFSPIIRFNDDGNTTFEDIRSILSEADI